MFITGGSPEYLLTVPYLCLPIPVVEQTIISDLHKISMGISICPANNGKSQARTLEMRVFKEQTIESLLDGMLPRSGFVQQLFLFYWRPSLHFRDFKVFFISMVMVIGPTPPGTGVMYLAISLAASKSTSPFKMGTIFLGSSLLGFSPTRLTPTSMTHAPSLIHSGFTLMALHRPLE